MTDFNCSPKLFMLECNGILIGGNAEYFIQITSVITLVYYEEIFSS